MAIFGHKTPNPPRRPALRSFRRRQGSRSEVGPHFGPLPLNALQECYHSQTIEKISPIGYTER